MTVSRLLCELDSAELTEWMAFERLEGPLGGGRGDAQAAMVSATVANVNRPRNTQAVNPGEFMPSWDHGGKRGQTAGEQKAAMRRWVTRSGGTVNEGG